MYYWLSLQSQRCRSNKPDNPIFSSSTPLSCFLSARLLHGKRPGKKKKKKKKKNRIDLTRLGEDGKGDIIRLFLPPPFLRHTLHVFRGEFSTTLLSPLEPVQIVILANWIEILTVRIVLTKCNTIMTLRNTFLQKCRLLFFFLSFPFFHNNFIFQTN